MFQLRFAEWWRTLLSRAERPRILVIPDGGSRPAGSSTVSLSSKRMGCPDWTGLLARFSWTRCAAYCAHSPRAMSTLPFSSRAARHSVEAAEEGTEVNRRASQQRACFWHGTPNRLVWATLELGGASPLVWFRTRPALAIIGWRFQTESLTSSPRAGRSSSPMPYFRSLASTLVIG